MMGSCWEPYRLAQWQPLSGGRIEWWEETARIEAQIIQSTAEQVQLRLQLARDVKEETYRIAQTPFVCPDLPR